MPLSKSTYKKSYTYFFDKPTGSINRFQTCRPFKYKGYFQLKNKIYVNNGFKISFEVDQITKEYDGFAVVVGKKRSPRGWDNSGLGYAGTGASLAIEFDFKSDSSKGDPQVKRHLSVIMSQNNKALELESIGWNDRLPNINDPTGKDYVAKARVNIEFVRQQLSVSINETPVL